VTGPNGHPTGTNELAHLSDADLAGYLDHDLAPYERRRVETHIDGCATCRGELVALSRVVHGEPASAQRPPRSRRWWIPAAAAAAVVALLVPRLTTNAPRVDETPRTRRVIDTDGRPRLAIVSPIDGTSVGGPVIFTWRAGGTADAYTIVVMTESGEPIWTTTTSDTTIALPDSVTLHPGRYFWRVDGIGNGIAATTTVHRIEVPAR
jgi:hypothetical protein